eukprot:TRINITY_DN16102_c0_g1_i2.p4 TRINITY_DN16102_c0_g1~~TRINITY_DN16102_c0_g1_i2.p4  ORF type:complete len:110 (+),score=13.34 TRINITY_DN16102_c0_g1_i2:540-869(+)
MIYMIDFGLAKLYRNIRTQSHLPFRSGKGLTGTARYASLNTHLGLEQSRRDDIECVLYALIFFLKGELPWQGLKGISKESKYRNIRDLKASIQFEELCSGLPRKLPSKA